jgi:hypothetical protein
VEGVDASEYLGEGGLAVGSMDIINVNLHIY